MKIFIVVVFGFSIILFSCTGKIEKQYYPTGELYIKRQYKSKNSILDSTFYKTGILKSVGQLTINNGDTVTEWYYYFNREGKLYAHANEILEVTFAGKDSIRSICTRRNFRKNGVMHVFADNRLWLQITYQNNKRNGPMISYDYDTGIKTSEEFFEDDKATGGTKFFRKDGTVDKIRYMKDKMIVKVEFFDEAGNLSKTITDRDSIDKSEGYFRGL